MSNETTVGDFSFRQECELPSGNWSGRFSKGAWMDCVAVYLPNGCEIHGTKAQAIATLRKWLVDGQVLLEKLEQAELKDTTEAGGDK